ncbi:hypothetical protein, partial [Lysinibacillus sp.]|uniref:hypothetical protein n=1 Tax=Lysinibacillus sp. TaxID=1869345 RepID=UPI0028A9FEB3
LLFYSKFFDEIGCAYWAISCSVNRIESSELSSIKLYSIVAFSGSIFLNNVKMLLNSSSTRLFVCVKLWSLK